MIFDLKLFATVFAAIFVAEIGDKTQFATMLFASDQSHSKLTVFTAAAAALVATSAIGVVAGTILGEWLNPKTMRWVAGLGFIAIGLWVLLSQET